MTTITAASVLKPGNTAVITGASSGIGRAAALDFASSKKMNVWMIDVDKEELELAHKMVSEDSKGNGDVKVEFRAVDVSDEDAMKKLADEVFADGGKCHFLFNNAGVGAGGGPMTEMKILNKTMSINTYGPIHGCQASSLNINIRPNPFFMLRFLMKTNIIIK